MAIFLAYFQECSTYIFEPISQNNFFMQNDAALLKINETILFFFLF